ncbi:MAG: hypothetical protein MJ016_02640 [Victivallaceae bacterium]|nr:hypothetical protein [Victivallaceae bacterium]
MKVVFICTGNTCRSPMAELYVASRLKGDARFEIASAGLATYGGSRISPAAGAVLKKLGIDPSFFRSRPATLEMLRSSDLVVAVIQTVPEKAPAIRLLAEFSGGDADVPDPFGGDQSTYDHIFAVMRPSLDGLVDYLKGTR